MDTLIKTPPDLRPKPLVPVQQIQSPDLWVHLAPEQQQKVLWILVITCRQIVRRLAEEQEGKNEG